MLIGVDMDGVLASFEHGYCPLLTAESGVLFPHLGEEWWPDKWDYEEGVTKEQLNHVWGKIKASDDFWYTLPPHKGAKEFLDAMNDKDVFFITNRPGRTSKQQTEDWLTDHGFMYPEVVVTERKAEACNQLGIDLYIDDKTENCLDVLNNAPSTNGFMLARPYNKRVHGVPRLESLREFQTYIEAAEKS